MPTKSFDFEQDPFSSDLQLKFFYKSSNLDLIFQQVSTDLKTGDNVIIISGINGVGKTFFLQKLKQEFAREVNFYTPEKTTNTFQSIVNGLCNYLDIDTQEKDFFENIIALDNYLNKPQIKQLRLALVIDDAYQFDDAVLKKLLMLAVAPSEQRGALQIILSGLPVLKDRIQKLELPDESQLERSNYDLQTLTTLQVREYIKARLLAAGSGRKDLFSPDAIVNIAMYSKGRPDLINKLCQSALSLVTGQKTQIVTKDTVEELIRTESNPLVEASAKRKIDKELDKDDSKTSIEKLHLKVKNTDEDFIIEQQKVKEDDLTNQGHVKEYAWGFATVLLLLMGIYFYSSRSSLLDIQDSKEGIAQVAKVDLNQKDKNVETQTIPEEIEKSDQALLAFDDSAEPATSLENLEPMLMANKKSLYQKVLTLPGATLFQQPKVSRQSAITLPAFSVYYVYLRIKNQNSEEWLQVGLGRKGDLAGWIRASKAQNWNQGLTVAFRESKNQDRVMLFKDKLSLKKMAEKYDFETYQRLYKSASEGEVSGDSPVVAIQPATGIDIHKNFYLLPIQDYEEIYLKDETARLLQVSSISSQSNSNNSENIPEMSGNNQQAGLPDSYKAGITFVIDSTLSMQPYITRTRKAVAKIYEKLEQANLLGQVNFGLMAFRDNTNAVPEIKYVTRQYVSLKQGENPQTFMSAVNSLGAAEISSQDFIEDSYAGVSNALNNMAWQPFAARYIVLITDAGAREANDPLSSSGLDAARIKKLAQEKGAAIFVMHILSTDSQADNAAAAKQYRELSNYPGIGSLYYAVPTANVQEFGSVIETLAQQITNQVSQINGGESKPLETSNQNERLAALQQKVAKLGHALELKYLQNINNGKVPEIYQAWVLDKDFNNPKNSALDVSVLLTRDQLSDLHNILKQVLETARQGQVSPKQFLNELKSLAATLVRDPKQLGSTTAATSSQNQSLAEMGFMREYIEDLPYTSELMGLSLEDWHSWSAQKQEDFLNSLQDKINYYRMIHDNLDLWISLEGKSIDGDAVFPVPLAMLP